MRLVGVHSTGTATPVSYYNEPDGQPDWWDGQLTSSTGVGDRPPRRPHRSEPDWMTRDYADEFTLMVQAGFDVVFMDMFWTAPHPDRQKMMMDAAQRVGLKIIPQPDTNSWSGNLKTFAAQDVVGQCVAHLAPLLDYGSWFTLTDGRLVISPYNCLANGWTAMLWKQIVDQLTQASGRRFAFIANLANGGTYAADIASFKQAFGPDLIGAGLWGGRSPKETLSSPALAKQAHDAGILHVQWIRVQDNRRRDRNYSAALGTLLLRSSWLAAIAGSADMVMLATADDRFEASQIMPGVKQGDGWLWLNSFYGWAFKDGQSPTVVKDAAFLAFRLQPFAAKPTGQSWPPMTLNASSDPDRDVCEAVVFLTAPAQITVDGTTIAGQPGANVVTVPQQLGTHRITVKRADVTVLDYTSRQQTQPSLPIQYLEYVVESTVHDRSFFQRAAEDPTLTLKAQLADMTAQRDTATAQVAALTTQTQTQAAKIAQAVRDLSA